MNLVIPKELRKYIDNQNYQIDFIRRSKATKIMLDDYVLKIESCSEGVSNEIKMLKWWKSKHLPVPGIIESMEMDGVNYLLMEKIKGGPSYEIIVRHSTEDLIDIVANNLKRLWEVDIKDCPSSQRVEDKLQKAKIRVEMDIVDVDRAEPDIFGPDGFEHPEALWRWLDANRPDESDLVLSHGDYSLTNLITSGRHLAGYTDLDQSGISDKYQDIAIGYRSLVNYLHGRFGRLQNFTEDEIDKYVILYFEKLEIEPDWDKIKYYILLNELL